MTGTGGNDVYNAYHQYGSNRKKYLKTERGGRPFCKRFAGDIWLCYSSGNLQVSAWYLHAHLCVRVRDGLRCHPCHFPALRSKYFTH